MGLKLFHNSGQIDSFKERATSLLKKPCQLFIFPSVTKFYKMVATSF